MTKHEIPKHEGMTNAEVRRGLLELAVTEAIGLVSRCSSFVIPSCLGISCFVICSSHGRSLIDDLTRSDALAATVGIYVSGVHGLPRRPNGIGRHDGKLVVARGLTFLARRILHGDGVPRRAGPPGVDCGRDRLFVAFLGLAILDDWRKRRRQHLEQLQQVNDWQQARCLRSWSAIPIPQGDAFPPQHAAVAKDLDLFGRASLFQLVNLAHTPRGMAMLRDWILEPATPHEIRDRQASVRELVPLVELREELVLRGHALADSLAGPDAFVRWVESEPYLERRPWIKWGSRLLPLCGLLAVVGLVAGVCCLPMRVASRSWWCSC